MSRAGDLNIFFDRIQHLEMWEFCFVLCVPILGMPKALFFIDIEPLSITSTGMSWGQESQYIQKSAFSFSAGYCFFLSCLKTVYLFILRENEDTGEGQRERGRERIQSKLHVASTEPDTGLKPTNHEIMIWAKTESQTLNWLSHPGTPAVYSFHDW